LILETALINSHIIYRNLPANKPRNVDHFHLRLSIVHDLLQAGSPSTMNSSSCIPASQKITRSAPPTQSALPSLPTRQVTKQTPQPLCRKVPGMHPPLWTESRVDCFLCRWRRSLGGRGEGMKTTIKCEDCNETLCITPNQNCFHEFHSLWSMSTYCGGICLDCGSVMCILKAGPSVGPNPVTGKGIQIYHYETLHLCTSHHSSFL
jgi:hypothetical protein